MNALPVQSPDHPIRIAAARNCSKVGGNQWRVGPVQQPRRQPVVLRCNQHFPIIDWWRGEVRAGVPDEVSEDMLLQIRLGVGRLVPSESIEAGEEGSTGVAVAAVHAAVPAPARSRVWLGWGHLVDQVAQALDYNFVDGHPDLNVRTFCPVTYDLAPLSGEFEDGIGIAWTG